MCPAMCLQHMYIAALSLSTLALKLDVIRERQLQALRQAVRILSLDLIASI